MTLTKIRAALQTLLAKKLVVAFIVGVASAFADSVESYAQNGTPLTEHLVVSLFVGAAAGSFARLLLAYSPVNIVPSDAATSLKFGSKPADPVHPEIAQWGTLAHLKLGRGPVVKDVRTLQLLRYLTTALPSPPPLYSLATAVKTWPMYGNDRLSDCTIAAIGHMIEAWTAALGKVKRLTEATVTRFYWRTGTPPSNTGRAGGPTDDGRVELEVLKAWRSNGIGGHKILAFTALDVADHRLAKVGTWLFGGLYIGLALPVTAQTQTVWDVVGDGKTGPATPGSWGGHAVDVVAYDEAGLTVVTWGALVRMTWAFWDAYVDEAYAIVSRDFLTAKGQTPQGFDLQALLADLKEVTA